MKQIPLIVIVTALGCSVSAQDDIAACVRNMFFKTDSLNKVGKNPFEEWKSCAIDKTMPSFKLVTINGDTINSKRIAGKIVVVNFWFIGCQPCIAEIPGMNRLVAGYKNDNVEFLAITWETSKRIEEEFLTKYKLDFKIIPDAKKYIAKVIASGYPITFILDTKGIIREAWAGGRTDDKAGDEFYKKAKPEIDRLLKAQ